MRVEILRDFRSWLRGEIACVSPVVGRVWIEDGVARLVGDGDHGDSAAPETAMLEHGRRAVLPPGRPKR